MRRWIALPVSIGALFTAGCTIVRIEGAKSAAVHAGVLRIAPADDAAVVVYRAQGFGIVPGYRSITVGAASETAIIAPPATCSVILFGPTRDVAERFALLASQNAGAWKICTTGEKAR
jgi:hypothetical protein